MNGHLVGGALAALVLTGCGGAGDAGDPVQAESGPSDFWTSYSADVGSEVDPPETIEELAGRSDFVVRARIARLEEGKDYSEPNRPPNRTTNVHLQVIASVPAGLTAAVVEFSRGPLVAVDSSVPPAGEYVFYLTRSTSGRADGVLACTSPALCAIDVAADGELLSPRDPVAVTWLKEPAADTWDEATLVREAERAPAAS